MKRLTWRHDHGIKMAAGYDFGIDPDDYDLVQEILERLAHYEDLEQQGRLVVLPCKVGDVVYKPVHGIDGDGVWAIKVGFIDYSWYEDGTVRAYGVGTVLPDDGGAEVRMADFGKDWFLTREEAERALEGGSGNA